MATKEELMTALRNADAAGDSESAQRIAGMINTMSNAPASEIPKSEVSPVDYSFSPMNMIGNIPESAANLAGNLAYPFMHPIETAQGMGKMIGGSASKLMEATGFPLMPDTFDEQTPEYYNPEAFDAAAGALGERYGSGEKALKTLERDPVGVLGDVAGVVSGAGALSGSSKVARAGAALNPINVGINTAKYGVDRLAAPFPGLPESLYGSATKFSTVLDDSERSALISTGLENKLMPTSAGMGALNSKISVIGDSIDNLIKQSVDSGQSLPVGTVFNQLGELWGKKGGALMEAGRDKASISKIARELRRNIENSGKKTLNADDLQKIKRDLYEKINFNSRNQTGTKIKEDVYKSVASSAKEGVENLVPEIGALNSEMGGLLELKPHLQRAAGRVENRDFVPLKATTGSGLAAIDPSAAAASAAVGFLELPRVKARAALILNELKNTGSREIFLKNNPAISQTELAAIIAGESMGGVLSGEQ